MLYFVDFLNEVKTEYGKLIKQLENDGIFVKKGWYDWIEVILPEKLSRMINGNTYDIQPVQMGSYKYQVKPTHIRAKLIKKDRYVLTQYTMDDRKLLTMHIHKKISNTLHI